jgi:hypothetical protein
MNSDSNGPGIQALSAGQLSFKQWSDEIFHGQISSDSGELSVEELSELLAVVG